MRAAQRGIVVHAGDLGIYGNCVVIDHGLGVQSLYGHLSSIGVKVGDTVEKGQALGRSGMTGLAGGDHLHFTMLVGGAAGDAGGLVEQAVDARTACCARSRPLAAPRKREAWSPYLYLTTEPSDQ